MLILKHGIKKSLPFNMLATHVFSLSTKYQSINLFKDGMNPTTDVCIIFVKHEGYKEKHAQHTMLLVPMASPGIKLVAQQSIFGYDNAPR